MDSLSDNVLMLKVKAGDLGKMGLLYERYKKRLFGFFYQMTKSAQLSEDLVQNVFVRSIKYKHTFREDSSFTTWIFHIARNVNYDHYKKDKKNYQSRALEGLEEQVADEVDVQNELIQQESRRALEESMALLPIEKREVLLLSKYKELKYKEIGEIIGCSEVAARTKAHRALKDLKEIYLKTFKE